MDPTPNIVWQLHLKDLRREWQTWSADRLREFAEGFQNQDSDLARAYLRAVALEQQRRSSTKVDS